MDRGDEFVDKFLDDFDQFTERILPVLRQLTGCDDDKAQSELKKACDTLEAKLTADQRGVFGDVIDLADGIRDDRNILHLFAGVFVALKYLNYSGAKIVEIIECLMANGIEKSLKKRAAF
jgi:hypothetical protein